MARMKQTARKSTGGMAPRRQLATIRAKRPTGSKRRYGKEDPEPAFRPSEVVRTGPTLGYGFSSDAVAGGNDVSKQPVFDMNDRNEVAEVMPGFTVSRGVIVTGNSMSSEDRNMMTKVIRQCKARHKDSNWAVLWKVPKTNKVVCVAENGDSEWKEEFKGLGKILENGQIFGCELRGDKDSGQFGLIATQDLKPSTPIAVETGIVWAEGYHDRMLDEEGKIDLGLASSWVPFDLLEHFMTKKDKKDYKKRHNKMETREEERYWPGFVIDSSSHGSETKHIEDGGWLCAGHGSAVKVPNLNTHLVFDLKREVMTVGYFVKDEGQHVVVSKGDELVVDWGDRCWKNYSCEHIPAQVMISMKRQAEREDKEQTCKDIGIKLPSEKGLENELKKQKPVFFSSGDVEKEEAEKISSYGPKYKLLHSIVFPTDDSDDEESSPGPVAISAKRAKFDFSKKSHRIAVRPKETSLLSKEARAVLDTLSSKNTVDHKVRAVLDADEDELKRRVKAIQITDPTNPANLFAVPGETARGVVANRNFKKDEPILAYGGILTDKEVPEGDAYTYAVEMPEGCERIEGLCILGKGSIGGFINDSWAPVGKLRRNPNVETWVHFDGESRTPQIVFYALGDIEKGEELLYSYGNKYWKVMWREILMDHAKFAEKTALYCERLDAAISEKLP